MRVGWFLAAVSSGLIGQTMERPTLDLAGTWRFEMDREDAGVAQHWFSRDLPDKIALPGILQAQGYGDEIRTDTPWVVTLGDAWWKLQPEELRAHFSQPGHVEVPFLSQPPRHYLGTAWYQRDIEIPSSWQNRRAELFLERARWETTVWVDGTALPSNRSLVAPHVFDCGILTPGRHRLSVRIDNRQIVRDDGHDGHAIDGHSVSDALGATWNGIVGRIELRATSPVWIDDAEVFPSVVNHAVRIKVTIGNVTGQPGTGGISVGDKSFPVTWDATGGAAEMEVGLPAGTPTWDEFHPALQQMTLSLRGGGADDSTSITFGLREVTYRDRDLLINGRVLNLRTTHFGGDFPLTGYPATDVSSWKKIIKVCQDYGMNGMRFHSWCPPEAAFVAADEMGFYLQPECGLWAPFNPGSVYSMYLGGETARLLKAFGNHPSFILLSPSNEPGGHYQLVTPAWAARWYQKDNRRLYSAGTGWSDPAQVNGGAQFASLVRYDGGQLRNVTGWFGRDYRRAVENVHIPVLAHEVGQWCAYPDFDVIKEFTGYLQPGNYHIFKYIAQQQGVLQYDHEFAHASGRFQLACYKEEIEANLRTPGLSGYQLLDLHDYLGQGTALIGLVDAFWKPKSYVTAAEFSRFNGPTVPLARLAQRTFTTADTLTSDVELYHFAEKPLEKAAPYWKIVDARGRIVAHGDWPLRDIPLGKNIPVGTITQSLQHFPAPAVYQLVVGVSDSARDRRAPARPQPIENSWNFWLYPVQIDPAVPADVLITDRWPDAEARLAAGGKVLFTPGADSLDPARSPAMAKVPVFWNIQMTARPPRNPLPKFDAMLGLWCDAAHPALAEFPTAENCDWQWTPLVDGVRSVNLSRAPRELKPIVAAIDDWNRNWRLGVIFECRVGAGKLLVSAIPLPANDSSVGVQQLRRSLLDYAASEKFQPTTILAPEQASDLWKIGAPFSSRVTAPRAADPDLDDGSTRQNGVRKIKF
jgi:hypothetical protein